jgi:CubicO group peptidase (beta-lactamase class C family)
MKNAVLACVLISSCGRAADLGELRSILSNRVVEGKKAVGVVAGVIDESGRHVIGQGRLAQTGNALPDGNTLFEIGSVTKVFTSLLLADMVERGEVMLDDPVAKYLPPTVTVPGRRGRQITLLDLSMQISGLPSLPDNFKPADPANPYADYSAPKLYEFLSRYALTRGIGEKYEYSNLGAGLLGHALALKAGISYEELVRRRILDPLGMTDTSIVLSGSQKERLAAGHNSALLPVGNWDFDVLRGAGALRSTANDMLKFLAANLELMDTPLRPALRRMRSVRRETGTPDLGIMLGWHVLDKFGTNVVWHNGGTAGYRTFLGFDPAAKKGVIVLCNTNLVPDDVGLHILDPRYPVARFAAVQEPEAVTLAPNVLARYAGEYEFAPGVAFKIIQDGSRLFAQATGQPTIELFASRNPGEFSLKAADARVTFTTDESGAVTGLILHQYGRDTKASKVPRSSTALRHELRDYQLSRPDNCNWRGVLKFVLV